MEERENQADVMGNLSVPWGEQGYPDVPASPNTDEEIFERISVTTSSYTIESNEDTFKLDTAFESFHRQARILMSDRLCWRVFSCYG